MSALADLIYERLNADRRRVVGVRCPFCSCVVEAHLWSIAGSGKRCECGAVIRRNNMTAGYVATEKEGR